MTVHRLTLRMLFWNFWLKRGIYIVPHSAYSPDLALCDFWPFHMTKKDLKGKNFVDEMAARKAFMPCFHSHLGYSLRLLANWERDEVRMNVDIHTLMRESPITRQDIWEIFISFDSGLIYWHVSESFETRQEQVKSMEDKTNAPLTLSFSSCLVLSRREC